MRPITDASNAAITAAMTSKLDIIRIRPIEAMTAWGYSALERQSIYEHANTDRAIPAGQRPPCDPIPGHDRADSRCKPLVSCRLCKRATGPNRFRPSVRAHVVSGVGARRGQ